MTITSKLIEAQNKWAKDNQSKPYRTPLMDLDLWEEIQPNTYKKAKELTNNDVNADHGSYWNSSYSTWTEFCSDTVNVWPIDKFEKDLNIPLRPQRPFSADHILKDMIKTNSGEFNHALAGAIHVGIRPDGSTNVWDHWHSVLLAKICGITHLKVSMTKHPSDWSIEDCRLYEMNLYQIKNGHSKKSTKEDIFVKSVAISKSKNETNNKTIIKDILDSLHIAADLTDPNKQAIQGIPTIIESRALLIKHHTDSSVADQKIKEYLAIMKEGFPKEVLSGYLFSGIVHFMISFEDMIEKLDTIHLHKFFKIHTATGLDQAKFISTSENYKGKSSESISVRIANLFNEWVFRYYQKTDTPIKRPITLKKATSVYGNDLPDLLIKSTFHQTNEYITVQCPHCHEMLEADVNSQNTRKLKV